MNRFHVQGDWHDEFNLEEEVDFLEDDFDSGEEVVLTPFADWKEREREHHRKHRLVRKLRVTVNH